MYRNRKMASNSFIFLNQKFSLNAATVLLNCPLYLSHILLADRNNLNIYILYIQHVQICLSVGTYTRHSYSHNNILVNYNSKLMGNGKLTNRILPCAAIGTFYMTECIVGLWLKFFMLNSLTYK